ncbi:pre-mRNA splicing factor ATP-dependent RNA helicase [Cryptosporidium ryanae]|uniref:pre-mRNA splicing factor ATP-dependent RNA helicase n=1 Tax=Cryptosporidium ryanae TaxID=515981 RepID=UPI00351A6231|nr:pre-mRNA splicing factor ATP-dependent RNA helicase [Cryptosporidium ryanae]
MSDIKRSPIPSSSPNDSITRLQISLNSVLQCIADAFSLIPEDAPIITRDQKTDDKEALSIVREEIAKCANDVSYWFESANESVYELANLRLLKGIEGEKFLQRIRNLKEKNNECNAQLKKTFNEFNDMYNRFDNEVNSYIDKFIKGKKEIDDKLNKMELTLGEITTNGNIILYMEELEELRILRKVQLRIYEEWQNEDRDLAEFLCHLGKESKSFEDFRDKIKELNGGDLPKTFLSDIYEIIHSKYISKEVKKEVKSSSSSIYNKHEELRFAIPNEKAPLSKKALELLKKEKPNYTDINQKNKGLKSTISSGFGMKDDIVKEGYGAITGIKLTDKKMSTNESKNRITNDYEKWEITQLVNSGALSVDEANSFGLRDINEDFDSCNIELSTEIELRNYEPQFLKGQSTKKFNVESSIQIFANPGGSLSKAAEIASNIAKERREIREFQEKALLDSIPRDMSRPWEDPIPGPGERTVASALQGIGMTSQVHPEWKRQFLGKSLSFGNKNNTLKSISEQRRNLPIFPLRDSLIELIRKNQIIVVIGETGSGKTTQITQYLFEEGFCNEGGIIGCTQPRRVAATSIARRVAQEIGCTLGSTVGFSIRFEDITSPDTKIKYMTDGMLLREALSDCTLSQYSVIMLDEAHERTITTDVLFGLLKETCKKRPSFRLIVTSATLEADKFSSYFMNCNIFRIPGRTFPVEIMYSKEPIDDYVEAALVTVLQIHLREPPGDILLFLTGQEEIDNACQTLHERMKKLENLKPPPLIILPVYSSQPSEIQSLIFEEAPRGCRKCVVATNIAEASLTIDGIYFVVDPGFCKIMVFNSKTGMDNLMVVPISQASANQRSGRAGRTGPGKCYRLYTEVSYHTEMLPTTIPEIQRTNLSNTVLLLKALGVNDLINFDFMDPPPTTTLLIALETLFELGALDEEGFLTRLGRKMAELPMEPKLSKMVLSSVDLGCSDEIITITSMLSVQNVFYRPKDKQAEADRKKSKFYHYQGDHLTYLNVYNSWKKQRYSVPWCFENFLQSRALKGAQDVRIQLINIFDKYKLEIISAGNDSDRIRKAICAGFFSNACRRDSQEGYRNIIDNQQVYLHPSSTLFNKSPEWILYHELVFTTKEYIRDCCTINPDWLVDFAPNLFQFADQSKLSKRRIREKIQPLYNKYEDNNPWRLSKRRK